MTPELTHFSQPTAIAVWRREGDRRWRRHT
jgi:hypothetical protein